MLLLIAGAAWPQDLDRQKAGVVKVTSRLDGARRTGTGFIVHLDADAAYIVTASHVVEGDNRPLIEFFTRRNATVEAETARIEGGDPRGLALLVVRGKDRLPAGIGALPLRRGADLRGGESVTTIGFPRGGGAWAVVRATVVSREGRDLMLDGSIDEGNSGGPVLMGENVVGVVTLLDGKFARAVPADLAGFVLEGWGVRPDAARAAKGAPAPPAERTEAPRSEQTSRPDASVEITRVVCERLRAGTSFRVTFNGQAQGPAGSVVRAALLRAGEEVSTPKTACQDWNGCRRGTSDPDGTRWSVSVIALGPVPTHAMVAVMPEGAAPATQAYATRRVELDCPRF
jgi:S1-C subfamily serine protease